MADDKKMYFKNKAENVYVDDKTDVKTALENKASKDHTHRTALSLIPTGTNIPQNADLNTIDYIKVGCYYCTSDSIVSTFKNCPTTTAFMMEVYSPISKSLDNESTDQWVQRTRKIMTYDGHIYIQLVNSSATAGTFTYYQWYTVYSGLDKPPVDTSLSTSSTNPVQNKVVATKISEKLSMSTSGGIASCNGSGKYTYFKIATIKITSSYQNRPIVFELSGRGKLFSTLQIMFNSNESSDPTLYKFVSDQITTFYIKKTATSTWEVYGTYNELWGEYTLHRITGCGANIGVTVNMTNIDSLPDDCTKAVNPTAGTITEVRMNGTIKGTTGIVDLGTVLTGGKQTTTSTADGGSNVYTFSDNSTITVKNGSKGTPGTNGTNGTSASWFTGTTVTGTSTTATSYEVTGSKAGDMYLNTSTYNIYKASAANSWVYVCNIKGVTGAKGDKGDKGEAGVNGVTPTIKAAAGSNINAVGTPTITANTVGTTTTFTFDKLKGTKGDKGDPGTNGTNGTSASWFTGTTVTGTSTTATPFTISGSKADDMYLNTSTYNVYKAAAANSWVYVCNIKGAKGDKGDKGSDGTNGTNGTSASWFTGTTVTGTSTTAVSFNVTGSKAGDMYLNTSTYNVYRASATNSWTYVCNIKGITGAKGDKGDKGDPGTNGTNGTSASWFTGTVVTGTSTTATSFTVSGSKAGDMYLNTSTYNVYRASAANSWVYICNIKGVTGAKGDKGDKGDPGTNGTNGTSASWFTGTTVTGTSTTATPFTVSGSKAGDMYLNTSTYNVYKAAAANSWVYVCNIKGVTGAKGDKGDKGDPGTNGTNGTSASWFAGTVVTGTSTTATSFTVSGSKAGDMYLNTSTYNVYKAAAANSWTYVCNIKGVTGAKGDKGDKGDPGVNATTTSVATTTANGLMSSTDKKKLDEVPNQYAIKVAPNPTNGAFCILAQPSSDDTQPAVLSITPGDNITLSTSGSIPADHLTIDAKDTTYDNATTSKSGLMSSTDKSKLDGIATGANKYVHPTYSKRSSGLYKVAVDETGHVSSVAVVSKSDITGLGISGSDHTHYYAESATVGGPAISALGVKNGGSPNGSDIYIMNSALPYADYLASWTPSGIQKIAISNLPVEKYTVLTSGDFNNYTGRDDGIAEYYMGNFGIAAGNLGAFTNCPETPNGRLSLITFVLKVFKGIVGVPAQQDTVWQEYTNMANGAKYVRYYTANSSTWSNWSKIAERYVPIDSGWIAFSNFGTGVKAYGTGTAAPCHYRRINNVVYVEAMFTPSVNKDSSVFTLATMPTDYIPSKRITTVQQGSGTCRWTCNLSTTGDLTCERYSNGTSSLSVNSGTWLCCYFSYLVD